LGGIYPWRKHLGVALPWKSLYNHRIIWASGEIFGERGCIANHRDGGVPKNGFELSVDVGIRRQ